MNEQPSHRMLQRALYRTARGLARIVLRHGMGGKELVHIVKKALVDVAREEHGKGGRPTNKARIAVMTGFTRAEVTRLVEEATFEKADVGSAHPLNRLVMHWLHEAPWASEVGQPKLIPIEGGADSFVALAHATGRDAAWQTLLAELTRTDVAVVKDGHVMLIKPGFLPAHDELSALPFLGEDVPALIDTMNFNLQTHHHSKRFQRKVVFPALTKAGWEHLNTVALTDGQALLEKLNTELRPHVLDTAQPGESLAGLGIYLIDYSDTEHDND